MPSSDNCDKSGANRISVVNGVDCVYFQESGSLK